MKDIVDLLSLLPGEMQNFITQMGEPAYRAKQVFDWLHNKRVTRLDEMRNIPNTLRLKLGESATIKTLGIKNKQVSADGTVKYLFSLPDGACIETVVMRYKHGVSICVSTQVGCRMGCAFCASTQNGLERNLSASEILLQVYAAQRELSERIDSVVLMGIGEPLDNYDNVLRFCSLITEPAGYNLSGRAISLSTCGLCEEIDALAGQGLQLTLSVSLHATTDDVRGELMPINRKYNIERLMKSCRNYVDKTGRRISFEYAVIKDKNDSMADARKLAALLKGMLAHINLIPVNPAVRPDFIATRKTAMDFCEKLCSLGINATVRRTLGTDISAACGQLRKDSV